MNNDSKWTIKNSKEVFENDFKVLDTFSGVLFYVTMNVEDLNPAQRVLLTLGARLLENIDLRMVALKEHILCASLELYIKLECLQKNLICQDGVGTKLKTYLCIFGVCKGLIKFA